MTKTEHYQLNQWDASDYVRREDFNEDNAKIDAAIKATNDSIPQFIFGTYTGNGSYPREITLGFKPKLVLLMSYSGQTWTTSGTYGGMFGPGASLGNAEVTETGFKLLREYTNQNGNTFYYLVMR